MRNLKLLVLSATFVVASAGMAVAGDCTKNAETAAAKAECSTTATAETAAVKTASVKADCASSASAVKTASAKADCASSASAVKTASAKADCASSASAVKTASAKADCASSASAVKTASAKADCASSASAVKTASAEECASKANVANAIKVETVRMPSGAMAVFYHGTNAEAVSYLQASAEKGCSGFACNLAKGMAADENCKVEMAKTESGVMMLVTSEKAEILDGYAAQYAAVTAPAPTSSDE